MAIKIIEESVDALADYEKVPIAFTVRTHFLVVPIQKGLGGLKFIEEPVTPCVKDYDAFESERPSQWHKHFDLSNWGIFSAFDGKFRIGGAATAWKTPAVEMLEDRDDLVCLWDLRVHPDYRNKGIGKLLFNRVISWGRERKCRRLKMETQNINVPACRFYARQGCDLRGINTYAYDAALNEIQLLWYLDL